LALAPPVAEALAVDHGRPFERQGLGEKWLFPFPSDRLAVHGPVNALWVGRVSQSGPRVQRITRTRAARELFCSLVVGVGLAQMAEWMLRLQAIPQLFAIANRRFFTMLRLLLAVEAIYLFDLSPDAFANAAAVREWSAK
jgi:hypothetical protein